MQVIFYAPGKQSLQTNKNSEEQVNMNVELKSYQEHTALKKSLFPSTLPGWYQIQVETKK